MYAKVFKTLWEGSLVGKSDAQLVFVFLLAHADAQGTVDYFPPVIASLTGLSEERVREALGELESEDGSSRSPEEGGRRIVRLDAHRDWGWRIVNYDRYRELRSREERRAQTREAMRRHRAKVAGLGDPLVSNGEPVATNHEQSEPKEKEKEKENLEHLPATRARLIRGSELKPPPEGFTRFWDAYKSPRRTGRPMCLAEWSRAKLEPISDQVLSALESFKATDQWKSGFEPEPIRWLKRQPWVDGPVAPERSEW